MNCYLFSDGSLTEQYLQLSQQHFQKMEEFEQSLSLLQELAANFVLSNMKPQSALTFNQQRFEATSAVTKNDAKTEELVLTLYGGSFEIAHRVLSQLNKINTLSGISPSIYRASEQLKALLTNMRKHGRRSLLRTTSLKSSHANNWGKMLQLNKVSIMEAYLSFHPSDLASAKRIFSLVNSVTAI
jgi:hypothetical protein